MARLSHDPYPLPDIDFPGRVDADVQKAALDAHWQALGDLERRSLELELSGRRPDITGGLLRFSVGDGFAYYLITACWPLEVQHVPAGDAYRVLRSTIHGLGWRQALGMLKWQAREYDLFGGPHVPAVR